MRLLMLILLLVTSEQPQIFSATGVYAPQVQEAPFQPESVTAIEGTDRDFYVVMFTAPWCQPCRQFHNSGSLDRLKRSFTVIEIDIEANPEWKKERKYTRPDGTIATKPEVTRLPAFWLARNANKNIEKKWVGAVDQETIQNAIRKLTKQDRTNVK